MDSYAEKSAFKTGQVKADFFFNDLLDDGNLNSCYSISMIDHLTLSSSNYDLAKKFYRAALAPLGYALVKEFGNDVAGFGIGDRLDFWLANDSKTTQPVFHLAFVAETREQVDRFYKAALQAGGRDNGAPGLREKHGPTYYAAFVLDPDGQNIEAVCRR